MKEDLKEILELMGVVILLSDIEGVSQEWQIQLKIIKSELNIIYNGMPND